MAGGVDGQAIAGELTLASARLRWSGRAAGHLGPGPHVGVSLAAGLGAPGTAWTSGAGTVQEPVEAEGQQAGLAARRAALVDLPWTWLRQVHGARVVVVDRPGAGAGEAADALVTRCHDAALAVFTADCAPLVLSAHEGVVGVVHAGWRGVMEGVVQATVEVMRAMGAGTVQGWLGPCIRAGCYEFGVADLNRVATALGEGVRATTMWGTTALDLPGAVTSALSQAGGVMVGDSGACTACSRHWYSHRAQGDTSRQATVAWLPAAPTGEPRG